ncbi:unnamed protein product [Adineta ricciae]|uniref:Globin-sensor domain-containing protein n=1 Tax=Adineta ricciae TaxID=249248 RepID=A0A813V333_ADIRI|nr:unnamed protein product [Adineta ricciae]
MMDEHIDSSRITTDLRYRYEYLSKFLNFTPNDITMLNSLAPHVFPRMPFIVDTVYRKLFSFDVTKTYFVMRNQGFEKFANGKEHQITIDSAQMAFRRDMLTMYLKRVLTQGDWNDAFLQYLSQIGKIHTNQAGTSSINVDYIHINALLGYLEHLLIDIVWTEESIDSESKHDMIKAVNKLFWIQNDFFTMHYLKTVKDLPPTTNVTVKEPRCCFIFNP